MKYNKILKNTFFTLDDKLQLLHLILQVSNMNSTLKWKIKTLNKI